jgi:hypothetical protein
MASSVRYIDAASGTPTTATTTDAMISASETTDEVTFVIGHRDEFGKVRIPNARSQT